MNPSSPASSRVIQHWTLCGLVLLGALAAAAPGCGKDEELQTVYGRRHGFGAEKSVNGTGTLGEMFEAAGHRVISWYRLSPKLQDKAEVIVWFPDSPGPPPLAAQEWFDDWLSDMPGRTLIYVPYDYDAEAAYWKQIQSSVPQDQQEALQARLARAERRLATIRKAHQDKDEDLGWFKLQPGEPRKAANLWGKDSWTSGLDASQVEIELCARMTLPDGPEVESEILLASDKDVIVARQIAGEGQVLCVANASFLLNLSLVNHEHRKLAGHLIDEVGQEKYVVFLEGGSQPGVDEDDPEQAAHGLLDLFGVEKLGLVLLHLAVVGLLFAMWKFPIFGLPRRLREGAVTDFGQHVAALGELLQKTRDRNYAQSRVIQYQQATARAESQTPGGGRSKPAP